MRSREATCSTIKCGRLAFIEYTLSGILLEYSRCYFLSSLEANEGSQVNETTCDKWWRQQVRFKVPLAAKRRW